MKQIKLTQIRLTNFKGIRELEINFNDGVTSICGRNGSGKTTIFDAFTWLLFGKDSQDRKAFEVKTLGNDGKPIEKLPHEVTGVVTVNGEEITLCRRFKEKWVRRRGAATEEFTGHEEERLYNGVPMSVKDWAEKISAICDEQTFKQITNPNFFPSQKAEVQRAMLMRMAGNVSDEEIAFGNDDFQRLLADLTGKTLDEYKREIAAAKRRIKAEIETIPARLEECKRMMPEAEDWQKLEGELKASQHLVRNFEKQLSDKAAAYSEAGSKRLAKAQRLNDLRSQLLEVNYKIKSDLLSDFNEQRSRQQQLQASVIRLMSDLGSAEKDLSGLNATLGSLKAEKEAVIRQWREVNSRQLQFNENEFVCPTCGRPLEIDDIERKQAELTANFNSRKAADLAEINRKGQALKQQITDCEGEITDCEANIAGLQTKIAAGKADELYNATLTQPDVTPAINADAGYQRITAEIAQLEKELSEVATAPDTSELNEAIRQANEATDSIKSKLAKRSVIETTNQRISELEAQLRVQSDELAQLEGKEFTMSAFSKAKIEAVEDNINSLFALVKFKMFETQINGGEVETCEATVDGVPYSDLNNAMRINAGLDIINAICKSEGVTAPIFIDNAEAVNELMPTQSQMIRLVVTEDKELTIIK